MKRARIRTGNNSEEQRLQRNRITTDENDITTQEKAAVLEEVAARVYGYNSTRSASWYDARRESGAVIEVKSAQEKEGSKYPAAGRFRLWREQHSKLVSYDRESSAFYVFVVLDESENPPIAELVRKNPADVGRLIAARGGFGPSGHASRGEQYKLPISAVF